jgi:hypothetical protein
MKWVALAILVFIAIYTPLTLKFRKPGPAYEPAADAERRMAEAAKWEKIDVRFERLTGGTDTPAPPRQPAQVTVASSNLPDGLRDALAAPPSLPAEITAVSAPAENGTGAACAIHFTCALESAGEQLAGAQVFRKADRVIVVPQIERSAGGSQARTADAAARVTLPAGALQAGRYTVVIAASTRAKQWTLEVR